MDGGGRNTPPNDQSQKELSISLAASSMINASDLITSEAYQANLKRIQEVKEMARKLEMNNEVAHKNFLVGQLEKRAKDGREAEGMLARLRNQSGLPDTIQFTNHPPSDSSEVILPTTATLVEVPESHPPPSYTLPGPITTPNLPQVKPGRPAQYQWSLPTQNQSYNPDVFRYYVPPPTVRQPLQYSAPPHRPAPVDRGQMGRYTTQNVPAQSRIHNPPAHQASFQPTQVQRPSQSWGSYPSQAHSLPTADTMPASGYYASPIEWIRTAPAHGSPNTGTSNPTYHEPGFLTQSAASRPPVTTHNQPQNPPSLTPTSQVQVPRLGVLAGSAKTPPDHALPIRSHSRLAGSRSQPIPTAVSNPVAISELQQPPKPPPQQHQQHSQQTRAQPQRLPQPLLQPRQHSQQQQPLLQPQQPPQQSQAHLPSQRPLQLPPTHPQAPPQSSNPAPPTHVSQPHSQPSQLPQSTTVQEQVPQRGPQPRMDQAVFIKLFQMAVQGGTSQLIALWSHAKKSGISDEWFNAAINSVPPDVWQSAMAQAHQSGPTPPPPGNTPQQQVSTISGSNAPVVSAAPPLIANSLVRTSPATQPAAKPSTSTEGRVALPSGQTSGLYTAQLRYYAEQATNAALPPQATNTSTSPAGNIAATQTPVATPKQDVPQASANVRAPRDANKSTLARDVLRSLGKILPKTHQEIGLMPTDEANNREGDQVSEVTPEQPGTCATSPNPPPVPPATSFSDVDSPLLLPAKANVQDEPQHVASQSPSTAKSVLEVEHEQVAVIEGPIMIGLTLGDSDDSVDRKGQDSAFLIQTSTSSAASSQAVSPSNTTNHTPLLENLSLEEPPVDVAADGDNADVRMYSSTSSFAVEEKMDSELLHPPLSSAESVSPSFEQLPREASAHTLDGQLPLFLPSPPVSPIHTEPPETDLEMTNDEGECRPSLKRRPVNFDEMDVDTELMIPSRARKRRRQQVYVLIPPAPPYVKKAIKDVKERAMREGVDSDFEGVREDEELQYSHFEQLLIEESKSRLLERRCRWLDCGAVLNCAANLLAHVKNHAHEEASQAPFLCRWANCQKQFGMEQGRDVHLQRHATRPLPCPFADCDEQFDKPVEVMQHEVQHQKVDRREPLIRKPTCRPMVPAIPARLGPPPQLLPSHRVIPRRVVKCRIPADRHATVGPWVLWNIFSPIDLNMRKQNATMRGRPTRQSINYDIDSLDPRRDDYDFLLAFSSYPAKNPQLDDLDSTLVTMSVARGLTLWGTGSTVNSAEGSATPEEHMNPVSVTMTVDAEAPSSATEETRVEGKSDGSDIAAATRGNSTPEKRQSGPSMVAGEEDVVERMLIL